MKTIKQFNWLVLAGLALLNYSCSKSKNTAEPEQQVNEWQFAGAVNIHATKSASGLDFYQYRGDKVRILQFEFDDYVTLFFLDSIVLKANDLRFPISSVEGFLSADNQFFDKKANRVFTPGNTKWAVGDAPYFNSVSNFETAYSNMVAADKNAANYDACIYSFEKPTVALAAQKTYIFFDFKNNKSIYYAPNTPTTIVKKTSTIAELFPNGNTIDWTKIDAACSDAEIGKTGDNIIYFFDFDAQKMYISARSDKTTGNPKMGKIDLAMDFNKQFHGKFTGSNNSVPFDFKK